MGEVSGESGEVGQRDEERAVTAEFVGGAAPSQEGVGAREVPE